MHLCHCHFLNVSMCVSKSAYLRHSMRDAAEIMWWSWYKRFVLSPNKQYNYVNMRHKLLSCVLILSRIIGPSFLVLTKYYLWVSGGEAVAGQQSWPAPSSCYHALSVTLSDIISYINISSYFICVHPQIVLYRWLVAAEIL